MIEQLAAANAAFRATDFAALRLERRSQMIRRSSRFEKDMQSLFRGL